MSIKVETLQKVFWSSSPRGQIDVVMIFGATRSDWSDIIQQIQWLDYKYLLITGKWSWWSKEKNIISQAEFIGQQCINHNIPLKKILLEKKSTNTLENVILSFSLLRRKKIIPKSICFISKSHHTLRCLLTLKKYFWNIVYSCITYNMERNAITIKNVDWMKNEEAYRVVKKEYDKISIYSTRWDIAPLMPPEK